MFSDIVGAVITAAAGLLIAFVNYIVSKKVLLKAPDKYSAVFVVRQILQVSYLVAVYFIGSKIQAAGLMYLLLGAVAGMTVPMFFFTKKLLTLNNQLNAKKTEKEDESDG